MLPAALVVYRFGPFELDAASGRLYQSGLPVRLPSPQSAMLVCLVTQAGNMVTREALSEAGWPKQEVTYDSVAQAISRLRRRLRATGKNIDTVAGRGYRFTAAVERVDGHRPAAPGDLDLAPYRAFIEGRSHLFTLNRDSIRRARHAFEDFLREHPGDAAAHIGLANACALTCEATRIDATCDVDALAEGERHARRAVALAPSSGDAWSALALVLYLKGEIDDSAAAARKSIALEPDDFHHWLRMAFVSWGEDRVRAARRMLALCPGIALGHWLIATVLIARGAFDAALDVLQEGCAAQDAQASGGGYFPAVGLHLLRGLVLGAQQQLDAAADALMRELTTLDQGQMYARECAANSWYALGAIRRRQRRREEAEAAFANALKVAPAHLYTRAALGQPLPSLGPGDPRVLDAAFAAAAGLARAGRHADAAHAWRAGVTESPVPCTGWILPVETLIDAGSHPEFWSEALAAVRRRAI